MPIQRADVAKSPLAQTCSMFTSELPSFLSLSPPFISVCFPCLHQFSVRGTASGCSKAADYLGLLCFPSVTSETWKSQAFLDPLSLSFLYTDPQPY